MDNAPEKNEWVNEKFLPSIFNYWRSKMSEENDFVFISEQQYNAIQKYLFKVDRFIESYFWDDKQVLVKTVNSKKGTFYLINFVSRLPECYDEILSYFINKMTNETKGKYTVILMAILEDLERDLTSDDMFSDWNRKLTNLLYTSTVEALTKINK